MPVYGPRTVRIGHHYGKPIVHFPRAVHVIRAQALAAAAAEAEASRSSWRWRRFLESAKAVIGKVRRPA